MSGQSRRLVLWLAAAALSVSLFLKGRDAPRKGESAAFLHYTSGAVLVRVTGDAPVPGVYRFSDGASVGGVINMTAPLLMGEVREREVLERKVHNGDVVHIGRRSGQPVEISMQKMKARERMALLIPLDPDSMDRDDWESLPGIGPALASRIASDRQKNGDFGSLEGLRRVSGIGDGTVGRIKKYF